MKKSFLVIMALLVLSLPALAKDEFLSMVEQEIYCAAYSQIAKNYHAEDGDAEKSKFYANLQTIWVNQIVEVAKTKFGIHHSRISALIRSEYEYWKEEFEDILDWEGPESFEFDGIVCRQIP